MIRIGIATNQFVGALWTSDWHDITACYHGWVFAGRHVGRAANLLTNMDGTLYADYSMDGVTVDFTESLGSGPTVTNHILPIKGMWSHFRLRFVGTPGGSSYPNNSYDMVAYLGLTNRDRGYVARSTLEQAGATPTAHVDSTGTATPQQSGGNSWYNVSQTPFIIASQPDYCMWTARSIDGTQVTTYGGGSSTRKPGFEFIEGFADYDGNTYPVFDLDSHVANPLVLDRVAIMLRSVLNQGTGSGGPYFTEGAGRYADSTQTWRIRVANFAPLTLPYALAP